MSTSLKERAEKQERIFREDPFDLRLKTHKLKGRMQEFWAFSVGYRHRIVFEFKEDRKVIFHAVDGHSVYKAF
ncbi:MAG: hypothetical protein HYT50_02435 [Candidatus Wildermuthbacteria bacterium]|nr:hypothetical protein [Candidatus Wildermuthbacteria bacterium]